MKIKTYDIDGVVSLDQYGVGIRPSYGSDILITGRSYEEEPETIKFLHLHGIYNTVYFNSVKFKDKTRESSGLHKVRTLKMLQESGYEILFHYEDDPIQAAVIREHTNVTVIRVDHGDAINLENERRDNV